MSDIELEVLTDLIRMDTTSLVGKDLEKAAVYLKNKLSSLGAEAEIIKGPNGTLNVLGRAGTGRPIVLLAAHYDAVPPGDGWSTNPFEPIVKGDLVYGRGAADDKSGASLLVGLLQELKGLRGSYYIAITGDEEVGGSDGLGHLVKVLPEIPDFAVIVDSDSGYLTCGASGVVSGVISVTGKGGHAGYPFKARNPIDALPSVLSKLSEFRAMREGIVSKLKAPPGSPREKVWGRFTVTVVKGGERFNMIPEAVELGFDMRLIPEEDEKRAKEQLAEFISSIKINGYSVKIKSVEGGGNFYTTPSNKYSKAFYDAIISGLPEKECIGELGGTDGKYTAKAGMDTFGIGAIDGDSNIHAKDEFVRISTIKRVKGLLLDALVAASRLG